ncbi:hypothetical protein OIU77_000039 [Salix suchowensis]|uniref:Pectin acetylesterase n=1 Tax=Salix suchowensis TaxID=1278906 RepID=A0ABQ9B5J1_9ROSI|nr:hypothetical protein OIU77_000039 [Salix suchowensis]
MELTVSTMLLILLILASWRVLSESRLLVDMTLVSDASNNGGFCLDGSLPAYHLHRGFGSGASNWLLQFEGGGWCNDIQSCLDRAKTKRGSSLYMNKLEDFNGILSNDASLNPGIVMEARFLEMPNLTTGHQSFTSEDKRFGKQSFLIFSPKVWGKQTRLCFQVALLGVYHPFSNAKTFTGHYRRIPL